MFKGLALSSLLLVCLAACQGQNQNHQLQTSELQTQGLINGEINADYPGVVQLEGDALCTGSLVGLNPPTVITAKHCVASGATPLLDVKPVKIITADFENYEYDTRTVAVPGDIAILIYPQSLAKSLTASKETIFSVAPVSLKWQSSFSICGYGSTNMSASHPNDDYGSLLCGKNFLVTENADFSFPELMKKISPDRNFFRRLSEQEKVEYIHGSLQLDLKAYGPRTRYGLGHFTADAFVKNPQKGLDEGNRNAMANTGDSGGAWFIPQGDDANPRLFAVTSMAQGDDSYQNNVVAAVSWRLDHPWSVALMKKAVAEGADILGFDELQKSVEQTSTNDKAQGL